MIILTNAVRERTDEGCLKVARSLVKRLKKAAPETVVATYDAWSALSEHHFQLNKLLLNRELFAFLKKRPEPVLYIPFPAKTMATALRVFILSRMVRHSLRVVLVMKSHMNRAAKLLLRFSGAEIVILSRDTQVFYQTIVPENRIAYLKTGVDTEKFLPVSREEKIALRRKYSFDSERPIILHVGHLKYGRGVAELLKLDPAWQIVLVASTLTKDEQDAALRQELQNRPNIRILDGYIPNIEEIYQLSDIYMFPVIQSGNCIDVPLSCLEAAACGKPVVTTHYGEMEEFAGKPGFYFMDSLEEDAWNRQISLALEENKNPRLAVLDYDWDRAVGYLQNQ